jgi:hypothetical protein
MHLMRCEFGLKSRARRTEYPQGLGKTKLEELALLELGREHRGAGWLTTRVRFGIDIVLLGRHGGME